MDDDDRCNGVDYEGDVNYEDQGSVVVVCTRVDADDDVDVALDAVCLRGCRWRLRC